MFESDFFAAAAVPCPGLGGGELKPLTLAQMVEMRAAIHQDLSAMALASVAADERGKTAAAVAAHVSELSLKGQAFLVVASPFLLAKAAALMLGNKEWAAAPMLAAQKVGREHIPAVKRAVMQSYGFRIPDPDEPAEEATGRENPPRAATDSAT